MPEDCPCDSEISRRTCLQEKANWWWWGVLRGKGGLRTQGEKTGDFQTGRELSGEAEPWWGHSSEQQGGAYHLQAQGCGE